MAQKLLDRVMAQKVNYGGRLMTRGEVVRKMQGEDFEHRCIDYFAFGIREIVGEEIERFCAMCGNCGARWQGVHAVTLKSCPDCKEEKVNDPSISRQG